MHSCRHAVRDGLKQGARKTWRRTFALNGLAKGFAKFLIATLLVIGATQRVVAQTAPQQINVGTFVLAPFVMEQNGKLTGFGIDLWEEIARRMHIQYHYQMMPDVAALFQAMKGGSVDIAVSGLFYTAERDRQFDFSYPIMQSGLRVMIRDSGGEATVTPLRSLADLLISRTTLIWIAVGFVLVIVIAHVAWLVERMHTSSTEEAEPYFPGIFRAMYWAATTLLSQGDQQPARWLGRILAVSWMFLGIVFVASYTAQLTSTLTVQHIRGAINGPDDLPDKRVGTFKGGSAIAYLNDHGAVVVEFSQNREMFQALQDGTVDAIVQGSPGLDYYANHEGKGLVKMVGPEFSPNDLGFVFPIASPLRKRIDGVLLSMREDGTYQKIYDRWFGTP